LVVFTVMPEPIAAAGLITGPASAGLFIRLMGLVIGCSLGKLPISCPAGSADGMEEVMEWRLPLPDLDDRWRPPWNVSLTARGAVTRGFPAGFAHGFCIRHKLGGQVIMAIGRLVAMLSSTTLA
jgi:hypothetical protein